MANPNPKQPKRKKRSVHSRGVRSGKRKRSGFDYNEAREELGLPNANSQQIAAELLQTDANPRPSRVKSPPKHVIKKQLAQKELQIAQLERGKERLEKKVDVLQRQLREFASSLKDEKHKSRLVMASLMDDAETMMADWIDDRVDLAVEKERKKASGVVREERQYLSAKITSRESAISFVLLKSCNSNVTSFTTTTTLSETKAKERAGESLCCVRSCSKATRCKDSAVERLICTAT
jgi:hypothetical protein